MNTHKISSVQWRALFRQHPSALLLAVQLVSLVLYAVFNEIPSGQSLISAFGVLVLALVVWVINRRTSIRWIAWVLAAPALVFLLLSVLYRDPNLLIWSSLIESVLYFYAAGSMVAYMMKDTRVTLDELFAAGATYTLLAWGFANAYQFCQTLFLGSFVGSIYPGQPWSFLELLSLSFTNLSTTGLGDIMPVTPPARLLVMLEQFAGVAYVAVVVSRLIGMTLARQTDRGGSQG
jgi:hypothetical protein